MFTVFTTTRYRCVRAALLALIIGHIAAQAGAQQTAVKPGAEDAADAPPTLTAIQRLLDAGRNAAALVALDRRIEADAGDVAARFLKGLALQESGDRASARDVYLEIAKLFPKLPEAFNNLAALYVADGDHEKARQALVSARANAPDYPLVHVNLGDLYLRMAADAYRRAVELNPDDVDAVNRLARLQRLLDGE